MKPKMLMKKKTKIMLKVMVPLIKEKSYTSFLQKLTFTKQINSLTKIQWQIGIYATFSFI